ncbi:hypothetical protein GGF42_004699, partial [Coemansia sp. RSA 2424]
AGPIPFVRHPDDTDTSPSASDRPFMRRSQSFSGMAYSPSEHQQHEEHQSQLQPHTGGFPAPATPTLSQRGGGAESLHMPSGTTMQSGHTVLIARSDSKYSSKTVASRSGDQRRSRQQRRKTDGSDEIQSVRRPSTSHASSPPRKIAYSQYPDFESITDPFAKRDKIPQKSERPFLLDVVAAPKTAAPSVSKTAEAKAVAQAARGREDDTNSAPLTPVRTHSQQRQNIGGSAPPNVAAKQTTQTVAALLETSSGDPFPEPQTDTPTPLRTRDKIPRHAAHPTPPSLTSSAQQRVEAPLRMDSMSNSSSNVPVTPTKPRPAASSTGAPRTMGKSLLISSLVSPVSPAHPASAGSRLLSPGKGSVSRMSPPPFSVDTTEMAALSTPERPFSGHKSSPRLLIDMDKVDTLYARRSVIFEKNRSKIRDRPEATATSPLGPQARSPAPAAGGGGLLAMVDEAKDGEDGEETDDHEGEHYIPFDQVLIPTAFKRLRAALEDPAFEIDEETYRRFKLSERWYSREEQAQMERSFAKGTFGESKKRSRIIQKRLSDISADSSALGHGHSPIDLPTPPANALLLHDQHGQRLESLKEEPADRQDPAAVIVHGAPERRRTRSSRRPSRRNYSHHADGDPAAIPRQIPMPGEYVPPPMGLAYGAQPEAHMQSASADYQVQQQQQPASEEAVQPRRNSRRHRPVAQPSTGVIEQTDKSSGGCCGCTIM